LAYFINKNTGYKFAMYSEVYDGNNEISFWTADDTRVDFLSVDVDYHLMPIIKKLANSKIKNSDLLSEEEKERIMNDCGYHELKVREVLRAEVSYEDQIDEPMGNITIDYPEPNDTITITSTDGNSYYFQNTSLTTTAMVNQTYDDNVPEQDCRA